MKAKFNFWLMSLSFFLPHALFAPRFLYANEAKESSNAAVVIKAKPNVQMQEVLDKLATMGGKPIETLKASEARTQPTPTDAVLALMKEKNMSMTPEPVGRVQDISIPGDKAQIPVRVYWPMGDGPFPLIVYLHGGGWVIASNDTYDATPRALVNQSKAVVLSVEYRKAPESKFPAAHDDAFAAYKWALRNAKSLQADPERVAVVGESAGGNMAVAISLMAREAGIKMPIHQVAIYPVAGSNLNSASYVEHQNAKPLNKAMMQWFFKQTVASNKQMNDPRLNLLKANLKGLPSATIITADIDPLRSDGSELANRMKDAGVDVSYRNFGGVVHEFFGMATLVDQAKDAQDFVGAQLRGAFNVRESTPRVSQNPAATQPAQL